MHALEVIIVRNAAAAGREAAESEDARAYREIERAQDEAVYEDRRLDRSARQVLLDVFHRAFLRESDSR
jgi:hypothetical protein